jgi:hypothetical protein
MKLYLKSKEKVPEKGESADFLTLIGGKSNKKPQPSFDLDSRADWAPLINISISRQ